MSMLKRSEAGLAVAIGVAAAASILLVQSAERWGPAGGEPRPAGVVLWFFVWGSLAVVAVLLGRTMNVTATGAGGVTVLGISLGAVLKASGVSDVAAAPLAITVSFVVMAAAAAGFHNPPRSREFAVAITFWLLAACLLAGSTWTCVSGE